MKRLFLKRTAVCAGGALLLLFLVRPSASRLQDRVTRSISAALGRNVEIGSLHLRFLPRPGFDIENLTIHDDARFGAEPLVRAPQVTAWLQAGALLRGHIQIARLSLEDASFNLTRNSAGDWNLADVLQRSSSITVAPTAASRHTAKKAFPYIEADGARVNLKIGEEKTHFALTDAKLALWQESDNAWGIRVQAQPIRTDANLTDTGVLALSGVWQRSAALRATPLHLSFSWTQAQIGQVTKLISGADRGWRGAIGLSGELAGTPENLNIATEASIDDFRGPDVIAGNDLHLAARCTAEYSITNNTVANLDCSAPSGDGSLELKGNLAGSAASSAPVSSFDLRLSAAGVPAKSILSVARHAGAALPASLTADGLTSASIHLARFGPDPVRIEGSGAIQNLRVISGSNRQMSLGTVPFNLSHDGAQKAPALGAYNLKRAALSAVAADDGPQIEFGPFDLKLNKTAPLQVRGSVFREGYAVFLRGDARISQLVQVAGVTGVPAPAVSADGNSTIDLRIAGGWNRERPTVTGTARLHSVIAQVRGLNGSISIDKANLVIGNDDVSVTNLTATAADATWHGSMRIPRPCAAPRDCELQVNMRAAEVSAAALNAYFNPAMQKQSWYRFLERRSDQPRYLLQARASGTVTIDKLVLGNAACSHFTAGLRLDQGQLWLSHLSAEALGGMISGDWQANFAVDPPAYKGGGEVQDVSLADVSELMHDGWIDGTANAKYEFTTTGRSLREAIDSATLDANFSVVDSVFPHLVLIRNSGPLRAQEFSGNAQLRTGEISLLDAKLETARGVYTVSGTASLAGALNFRIVGEGVPGYSVSGTILETRVAANPTTAASLKP